MKLDEDKGKGSATNGTKSVSERLEEEVLRELRELPLLSSFFLLEQMFCYIQNPFLLWHILSSLLSDIALQQNNGVASEKLLLIIDAIVCSWRSLCKVFNL